jgi:hypothetical protein
MTIAKIIRIGSSSLRNFIVLCFVVWSLPMTAMFGVSSYQDGELTPLWMLWIFGVCTLCGLVFALIGWFIILPPILRRSGRKRD